MLSAPLEWGLSQVAVTTPSSDIGPEPRNIQNVSRAWTVPSRRCRIAPKLLKTAPWRMSVPTASVGLKPKTITRIGVSSEPPPMPVIPTRAPIRKPLSVNCQVTDSGRWPICSDQHFGDLGPRELDRRQFARGEQLPHLRPREEDVVVPAVRARLRRRHLPADAAVERVLEEHRSEEH